MPVKVDSVISFNGGVQISSAEPYSVVVRIPPNVDIRHGSLALRNMHGTAVMYFKWTNMNESTVFRADDAGIVLSPGQGFDTDILRPGRQLVGQSTVNNAICAVDFGALLKE